MTALADPTRLAAARRLGLLEQRHDETLDRLTEIARASVRARIAIIAATDGEQQLLKASAGQLPAGTPPLAAAPCREICETGQPLAVPDARAAGLATDRAALADVGFPAFAGVPVKSRDDLTVAVLAALDREARAWDTDEMALLEQLAAAVAAHLDLTATLRQREERYRLAVGVAADGVVTIDDKSRILFTNPALERIFGYSRTELMGQSLTLLMPEDLRPRHEAALGRYVESGKRTLAWDGTELTGRHKSGKLIPIEVSFAEGTASGARFFTGIIRDLGNRRRSKKRDT